MSRKLRQMKRDPGKALGEDHATKDKLSSAKAPRSYLECSR